MDFDINVSKTLDEAVKDTICNIINVNMSKNDVQTREILTFIQGNVLVVWESRSARKEV